MHPGLEESKKPLKTALKSERQKMLAKEHSELILAKVDFK